MPKIHVHEPFTLTRADASTQAFATGEHEVSAEDASHWYVKAHSMTLLSNIEFPEPQPLPLPDNIPLVKSGDDPPATDEKKN